MYTYIFVWMIFLMIFVVQTKFYSVELINDVKVQRWHLIVAILLFVPVFWLACMGTPINDVPVYISSYQNLPKENVGAYLKEMESGQGFVIIEYLIKYIFNDSVTAFRVVLALIHSIPIIWIFRKYSDNYWISIYMFVASACHIGWMMNGMRQFIAVVMILSALPLMVKKEYVKLTIIVLLACTVHVSAIIMLPIVFIVQGKAWNEKTMLFIIMAIVMVFLLSKNMLVVDEFFVGTEFEGAIATVQESGDDGVHPIRVLVSAMPMLLALVQKNRIAKESNQLIHICINMSIITVGLNLIAMVTSGILLGRLAIYTSLYGFIIMPYLVENAFTKKSQMIVNLLLVILYFIFYCFEMGVL